MKQTFYEVGCDVDSIKRIDRCLIGTGVIYSRDEDDYEYEDYFTFVYIPDKSPKAQAFKLSLFIPVQLK